MHLPASRIVCSAALAAGMAFTLTAGAADLPPIPVIPTVPVPGAPSAQPVRLQNMLPAPAPVANGDKPADPAPAADGPELCLGDCLAIAVDRQPALRAARAGGAATAAGAASLANIGKLGALLSPDLEIRKQQAERGLVASAAEYQRTYNEVVEDVTRLYYTAVYARQQEAIAKDVIAYVEQQADFAEKLIKAAVNVKELEGLTLGKVQAVRTELGKVRVEQVKARIGREQALAALRERMGVDGRTFPFQPKDTVLPGMRVDNPISQDLVVDLALCRRPELALAAAGVDAFRLEVYAQGKVQFKKVVPTFASGADIHAKEIPPASRGAEYRPGGLSPELPPQLVGSRADRVTRALAFSQRAEEVFAGTRGLVQLDAENGYLVFEAKTENLRVAEGRQRAAGALKKLSEDNAQNVKDKTLLVQAELIVFAAESDYVKAVYEHLLALAALERITAGGIRPDFPGR